MVNCRYRFCDTTGSASPSTNVNGSFPPGDIVGSKIDLFCYNLPKPSTYTGPIETWWAPYDNDTSEATSTSPYNAAWTHFSYGFLYPYIKTMAVFKDPSEDKYQVSYAMSYIYYGPMGLPEGQVLNPSALVIWDHRNTPGCADTSGHSSSSDQDGQNGFVNERRPYPIEPTGTLVTASSIATHYPDRHNGGFIALAYDGSVKFRNPKGLTYKDFAANPNMCDTTNDTTCPSIN
jgi:hypothetical protein